MAVTRYAPDAQVHALLLLRERVRLIVHRYVALDEQNRSYGEDVEDGHQRLRGGISGFHSGLCP